VGLFEVGFGADAPGFEGGDFFAEDDDFIAGGSVDWHRRHGMEEE
jgi:hypothetical protein